MAQRDEQSFPSAWTVRRQALVAVGGFDESLQHSERRPDAGLAASGYQGLDHKGACALPIRRQLQRSSAQLRTTPRHEKHLKELPASEQAWVREQRYSTTTWQSGRL